MEYKTLFTPMSIGNVEIKNRIVMPPMMLGFGQFNGKPTREMMDYYEERAIGGAGLIITEITRVDDFSGASAFAQLAISHNYHIKPLAEMISRVHSHGAKMFVQLHHPGRQNLTLMMGTVPISVGMERVMGSLYGKIFYKVAPAAKKLMEADLLPKVYSPSECDRAYSAESLNKEMTVKQIEKIISEFIQGAVRAKKAGADGVELHAAHGYLIQQFLSPYTNQRTDEYGGSFDKRMKFLLDILKGIKEACGSDFPVIVRLSVDECYDKIGKVGVGYTLDDGIRMAKIIEEAGADAIDVSSAGYDTYNYWLEPTSFECGWRAYMAKAIKDAVNIPVLAANLIRSPEQAEKQLQDGIQDFVSLGRPQIADPHWANKVKEGREDEISRCICCLYCMESMQNNAYKGTHANCSVNPKLGKEKETLKESGDSRHVVVIGAGPAGLTCAKILALRKYKVTVLEKQENAGGQLLLAAAPPHKDKMNWLIEDLKTSAEKAGVEIKYGVDVNKDTIQEIAPYAVILATGAQAIKPKSIKGVELENVYTTTQLLDKSIEIKDKKVAVIGSGMTGLETAEMLCENGNQVTIVEMADTIAPGTWMQHIDDCLPRLKEHNTKFITNHKLIEIDKSGVVLVDVESGNIMTEKADYVVLSLGVRSVNELYGDIRSICQNVFVIGDAEKTGRIADATAQGYEIGKRL